MKGVFPIFFALGADIPLWGLSRPFVFLPFLNGLHGFWHFLRLFKWVPDFNQGIWKEYEFYGSILFLTVAQ